ncbi:MAG TPA: hypothetical protein VLS25_09555 [Dehalococcoidia bacterium]|nr:hypothetical protein [Dehalococcoidia bacterium]
MLKVLSLLPIVSLGVALCALMTWRGASGEIDLTGAWHLDIHGGITASCTLEVDQSGTDASGTFDCGGGITGSFGGTVTPEDHGATLDVTMSVVPFPGLTVDVHATGTVASDGNSFDGTWAAPQYGLSGTFHGARPAGADLQGDVDCNGAVNSVDALKVLRSVVQLSVVREAGCPVIGANLPPLFGDVDCSNGVSSVDGLKILRFVASLPIEQSDSCTRLGDPLPGAIA